MSPTLIPSRTNRNNLLYHDRLYLQNPFFYGILVLLLMLCCGCCYFCLWIYQKEQQEQKMHHEHSSKSKLSIINEHDSLNTEQGNTAKYKFSASSTANSSALYEKDGPAPTANIIRAFFLMQMDRPQHKKQSIAMRPPIAMSLGSKT